MQIENISVTLAAAFAFLGGLASFLSPCVFTLVPAYIGYLGGRSAAYASAGKNERWLTFTHGLAFVSGFSIIFIALGFTSSAIGGLLYDLSPWLAKIGGIIVVIFGIHMTGLVRIPFLEYDLRPQSMPDRKWGYLSSIMMGVFFSAGWSPCIGPILASILTFAAQGTDVLQGALLLASYSAGLAIPFLIATTQISLVTIAIRKYGKLMHYVEVGMGVLLIVVGLMLVFGLFTRLAIIGSTFLFSIDELSVGRYLLAGVLALVLSGLIPAFIAQRKGRNFTDWWFFGTGLLPVALIAALKLEPREVNGPDIEETDRPKAEQSG